ncbi:beta-1,4-xylosyltransferase IRX14-like [Impatiens glandulifera]|uniref:beta-1,4-xylosyltransferase IRX14-like n=1 Tax=Impatiens glandulifera TaxID=253017 RepID=UPI001FB0DEB4|nr:beta-1,4-xylosyltransferase IRX14-like [Impatiens glandulifera]
MKLSALQQNYLNPRRINSLRASTPLDSSSDGSIKSPVAIFWLILHGICCLISLILGYRFSRLVFFLLFSTSSINNLYNSPFRTASEIARALTIQTNTGSLANKTVIPSSRVVVGRHGILIRPWPHPDPVEVMKAHRIIERVQREQRLQFGVKYPRTIIAITPTYVRTFQALHLTGVMHSLMNVPYDVIWIVVEAGGTTNETASLIGKSGLRIIHVGFDMKMPISWEERHNTEADMRVHALRIVKRERLDGILMFADDSNMHSLELFDEIQKVKWIGAVSVGILLHSSDPDDPTPKVNEEEEGNRHMPVQGPACNSSESLVGWHTLNSLPYTRTANYIGGRGVVLPRKLEWSGFVLNSRLIWNEAQDKPNWINDLDDIAENGKVLESPLSLVKDQSMVEPLGSCGRKIFLWWLRVEARADSKFPASWIIDPPLEITVMAKHTPWPDAPPELAVDIEENKEKSASKNRSHKLRRSSRIKHKREAKTTNTRVEQRHPGEK